MADILHRIIIETSPEKVYSALTEQDQLSAWWTKATTEGKLGTIASFFFDPKSEHQIKMKLTDLIPNERICWKCIEGPWIDTKAFIFNIQANERGAALQFSHTGWLEANEFFMHCNSK